MIFKVPFTKQAFFKLSIFLYIILKPFYIFENGLPQIADFIMLCAFLPFIFSIRLADLKIHKSFKFLLLFFLVVILVNTIYFFSSASSSMSYIVSIVFFGFNGMLFLFCFKTIRSFSVKEFSGLIYAILIALLLQFLLFIVGYDKGLENDEINFYGRAYTSFNNPNQLSYYCVLLATIAIFISKKVKVARYVVSIILSISLVLIASASTRPAVLGIVLFIIYFFIFLLKKNILKEIFVFIIPLLLVAIFQGDKVVSEYNRMVSRFTRIEVTTVKEAEDRGYERIFENPELLIYGAGEGDYKRFLKSTEDVPKEIHSAFGTIWFSYGVFGMLFFCLFLYFTLCNLKIVDLLLISPLILYNLFHNGFRFSILWMLFAVLFYLNQKKEIVEV